MFREMRRAGQALSQAECAEILNKGTSGVLAVSGDGGYPYAVPLSYAFYGEKIYFHSALAGHKVDAVRKDGRVSFCVTDRDEVHPEKYTTYFRSVIAFGRARILEDEAERRAALTLLAEKYAPGDKAGGEREIDGQIARTCLIELSIEHITGKQAKELKGLNQT